MNIRPFDLYTAPPVQIEIKYGEKDAQRGFPKKLQYLKVVERYDKAKGRNSNWNTCTDVHEALNSNEPRRIPIVLLSDSIEENFPLHRAFFMGAGNLMCSSKYGSSTALRRFESDSEGNMVRGNDRQPVMTAPYEYDQCNSDCKIWKAGKTKMGACDISGSLYFYLGGNLPRGNEFGVCRIKGTNAQRRLLASLQIIRNSTRGILAGIPLDLCYHTEQMQGSDGSFYEIPLLSVQMGTKTRDEFMLAVAKEVRRRKELAELLGETAIHKVNILNQVASREAFSVVAEEDADIAEPLSEDDDDTPDELPDMKNVPPKLRASLVSQYTEGKITLDELRQRIT